MTRVSADKALIFVAHVQKHLDLGEQDTSNGRSIPKGKVGCKICEKSIDRIYAEEKRRMIIK